MSTPTAITPEQKFERILLGSLTANKEYFSKVLGILKPEFFSQERRDIFNSIKKHYKEYSLPPSLGDLEMSIKDTQNQDQRNRIFQELQQIGDLDTSKYNTDKLCDETLSFVKDALYLKALEIGSEGLLTKNDDLKRKAEQILDERAKVNIDSDLGIEFSDATAVIDYYSQETTGLLTQHYSLNERLGPGFLPGTLNLILAPSGVGKSLMMTDLISGFIKAGKNVLLVSLEMSAEEVMKRVHSNTLEMPIADFVPRHFNKDLFIKKLNEAKLKGCGTFWTKDYPPNSFSALNLESLVESFKNEKNLSFDIVFIDYIGIMKSDLLSPSAGLYSYVKSIAEEVRAASKRLNLVTVSASQLNRGATNNLEADNSAVSDSMGSVMTADFLMFLLQTEEMKEKGDIICKITKNRYTGKTETFPMRVNYELMRFEDPEIPKSLEARKEMKDLFETNVQQVEQILEEHHRIDKENAKVLDQKMRSEVKEPTNPANPTNALEVIDEWAGLFN